MTLDERDERPDAIGKGLAGHPELALDRANVRNALRALFKDREMLTAQATAQRIGSVERELPLALERAFDGTTDFSRRHRLGNFTVETSGLSGTHHFVAGLGQQEDACIFQGIEARHGRCGFGNRSRRRICRGYAVSLGCSLRSGHGNRRRFRGSAGKFPRVTGGFLHLLEPLIHDLGVADGLDAPAECLERHACYFRGMVLLDDLRVTMIVGRPEQLARDGALVNDLIIPLRWIDLDLCLFKKFIKVIG